jgi:hypothetical protein
MVPLPTAEVVVLAKLQVAVLRQINSDRRQSGKNSFDVVGFNWRGISVAAEMIPLAIALGPCGIAASKTPFSMAQR